MLNLVEGWTAPINEQLLLDGAPANLTGFTAVLQLYPAGARSPKTLTGTTSIVSASIGTVQFLPGTNDLLATESPYAVRWVITVSPGQFAYAPSGAPSVWIVRRP